MYIFNFIFYVLNSIKVYSETIQCILNFVLYFNDIEHYRNVYLNTIFRFEIFETNAQQICMYVSSVVRRKRLEFCFSWPSRKLNVWKLRMQSLTKMFGLGICKQNIWWTIWRWFFSLSFYCTILAQIRNLLTIWIISIPYKSGNYCSLY